MKRAPLAERTLPNYTREEDLANMITHIVGGAIGILTLILVILRAAAHQSIWGMVSGILYGVSMICLYSVSSVYHGLRPGYAKKVMQVIDHCTIYFLIAGTYTPILLTAIRPQFPALAWTLFGIEWGLTALATVFTAIDHHRYGKFSMFCYILMGWCIIFATPPTLQTVGTAGFLWLIAGGISYTVGALLYGIGKKHPLFHTIFHVFVDIGSLLQAVCILCYVL